jgi:hypothetical protein
MNELYSGKPPLPDFMSENGPHVYPANGNPEQGFNTFIIYEFEEAKMAEACFYLIARYNRYSELPGYTYSITVCASVDDMERINKYAV